jgi:hypothetical protein
MAASHLPSSQCAAGGGGGGTQAAGAVHVAEVFVRPPQQRPPLAHVLCTRTKWRLQNRVPAYRQARTRHRAFLNIKARAQINPAFAALVDLEVRPAIRPRGLAR